MDIAEARATYRAAGDISETESEIQAQILQNFHATNPVLPNDQWNDLNSVLKNSTDWNDKFFVAELISYYDKIDRDLLPSLIQAAIDIKDPSWNRTFLRTCIKSFSHLEITEELCSKYLTSTLPERIGICSLTYWLNAYEVNIQKLNALIESTAKTTTNLVELFYCQLALPERNDLFGSSRMNAYDLLSQTKGDANYERLLDEIGFKWQFNELRRD